MLYHAKGTIGYYQRSLAYAAGVWGVVSLSAGPEVGALMGVQGSKPLEDLEILHFTVPG